MANNQNVNKVVYGDQTVMDISDTTAQEGDVAEGQVFYKGDGSRSVGTGNYYSPNDTAETDIQDADYFPFYDDSATAKKKSLWSNIKAKLKTYFDTLYVSWNDNAIIGAHNFFNKNYVSYLGPGVSVGASSTGVQVSSSAANTWLYAVYPVLYLRNNVDYKLKCDGVINVSGGYVGVFLYGTNGLPQVTGATNLNISFSSYSSKNGIELNFNSSTYKYILVVLYCTGGTSVAGNTSYNNFMIVEANDKGGYAPYAPMNYQLAERTKYVLGNGAHYTTSTTSNYIKITLLQPASFYYMVSFTVTVYQNYRAFKIMISGYIYGSNYWYTPQAVLLGDSQPTGYSSYINILFGYDSDGRCWVGFSGRAYTGVTISDLAVGYQIVKNPEDLFKIEGVSSISGTQQASVPAKPVLPRIIRNSYASGTLPRAINLSANQLYYSYVTISDSTTISRFLNNGAFIAGGYVTSGVCVMGTWLYNLTSSSMTVYVGLMATNAVSNVSSVRIYYDYFDCPV